MKSQDCNIEILTQEELDTIVKVFGINRIIKSCNGYRNNLSNLFQKYSNDIFQYYIEKASDIVDYYIYETEILYKILNSEVLFTEEQLVFLMTNGEKIIKDKYYEYRIKSYIKKFAEYFMLNNLQPFELFRNLLDEHREYFEDKNSSESFEAELLQFIFGNYRCQITTTYWNATKNDPRIMFDNIIARKEFSSEILNLINSVAYIVQENKNKPLESIYDFMCEETFHDTKKVLQDMILSEQKEIKNYILYLIGLDLVAIGKVLKDNHKISTTIIINKCTFPEVTDNGLFSDNTIILNITKNRKGKESTLEIEISIKDIGTTEKQTAEKILSILKN